MINIIPQYIDTFKNKLLKVTKKLLNFGALRSSLLDYEIMRKKITYEYSSAGLKKNILTNAKSLHLPEAWAKQIADRVVKNIDKWIADKELITEDDLRKQIVKELKVLEPNLAFAYRNHDKII